MKAVLVIDMPDGYETDEVLIDYVLTTKGEYKVLRQGGNHKVRPMPKRAFIDQGVPFNEGWNACIDAIVGETE